MASFKVLRIWLNFIIIFLSPSFLSPWARVQQRALLACIAPTGRRRTTTCPQPSDSDRLLFVGALKYRRMHHNYSEESAKNYRKCYATYLPAPSKPDWILFLSRGKRTCSRPCWFVPSDLRQSTKYMNLNNTSCCKKFSGTAVCHACSLAHNTIANSSGHYKIRSFMFEEAK